MTSEHLDSRVRVSLYIAVAAVGATLVVWGVVTQELVDAILPTAAGILAVGGGATAVRNITPNDRGEGPELMEWVRIGRDTLPVVLDEVRQLRAQVESQALALPAHVPTGSIEYVPDHAPWLPQPEYVGEHRLGG